MFGTPSSSSALFSNLNTKSDVVATHVKKLETQVTQTMKSVKRQEAESKKSFCNSAAIEERFEDQVPEWMLSKPTVDCMIWLEEIYPERESNRARKRRLFPKIIPRLITQESLLCLVSSKVTFLSNLYPHRFSDCGNERE
ncbi:unnamed protein product [Microthlaspi erraticum]|uniref:Uncharacterized protein n=1 Tax=Microthlaspi erraticum TaxID=1685480 RepID=A0A6D2IV48_9BRAS|nr:unnamed protein product [Microthlaspi erraticum]